MKYEFPKNRHLRYMIAKILIIFYVISYVYSYKIGIIGPTGAVGQEIINSLYSQLGDKSKITDIKLFASKRSAGKFIDTPFGKKKIDLFEVNKARECDYNFLAVSGDFSKRYAKALSYGEKGCVVIDNSSAFRYDKDVPLVIPEINGKEVKNKKLISNPNCTTAIALIVLYPIFIKYGIKKLLMSTYQAASGAGNMGMQELDDGVKDYVTKNTYPTYNYIFSHPLPFNVIPHIDSFQSNGYTKEEMKVAWETKKIFNDENIKVSCTAVRVPTFRAHAESVVLETDKEIKDIDEIKKLLSMSPGVELKDNIKDNEYPMPISASKKNTVEVGRIRKSIIYGDNGIEMFICGDQLLRGAALNAVLILKHILEEDKLLD